MGDDRIVGAYLRVSSRSQSVATQRATIETAARARGDVIGQWWVEVEGGGKLERPVLANVRQAAAFGELGRLWIYKLDRLTRTGIRDTLGLLQELEGRGCQVVSVADPFDLASPLAEVIVSVIAWAAEQERRVIGERLADARRRVERQGGNWGRPRRAIPMATLKRAASMVEGGASYSQVARQLGVHRSTLQRCLARSAQKPPLKVEPVTPLNHMGGKHRP